ncbi:alpha-L-arabinofuranosidase C-terminal domain-containing protein [Paenibacillus sp. S150]|uniref:alpha-L-arabinofuranosidase C-terminal domain-containing protein n=1 Tax=Paenibacillus sp. S150 TaxID=2749826 RepID=UPI001C567A8C|nr:alpha-L-arabinofuranosidase C-terminal domain-containing protein [Paenibacillus sp. S150]MBW4080338.1 carbohydrate binding domain-containing protein [Paenibacillus sp. S150]
MTEKEQVLKIHTQQRGAALGDLFGIFFEDLNHAADGGLYAELVQNRSFEFDPVDHKSYHALTAWEKIERGDARAEITIGDHDPLHPRNPHYAVLDLHSSGGSAGIMNLGFNSGIPVRAGESYLFSVYVRCLDGSEKPLSITLEGVEGSIHAQSSIVAKGSEWTRYEASLTAERTDYSSRLVISGNWSGKVCLDMVSLFPAQTFLGRPGGLREDIALLLAGLKPKFMRFPGGCLVHDGSLNAEDRDSMYRWKNTLGDVSARPARRNNWSYNQTLGLGYYEYFQFCEDIGAKPIPVLPGGYDPHHKRMVPLDELGPWIADALDLIEFAAGDAGTEWGGIRAGLGHPEPFGLEYIGIGNEEVGEPFFERYAYFHKAIKEKYPHMKVINSSGPFAAGGEYERGWRSAREQGSDLVDEHYYQSPAWFLANIHRYKNFKADEPKVFLGEYASWGNKYYNALIEAAFMTGLENNAHAVGLACYAPLLCNADYANWKPDMIWFNNHEVYPTPNYYVQKLFMNHHGDQLLKAEASGFAAPVAPADTPITGKIAIAADASSFRVYDIELENSATGGKQGYPELDAIISALPDAEASGVKHTLELGEGAGDHYIIRLKVLRIAGSKGFKLYFGRQDERNQLWWEVGGWQNQDTMICSMVDGSAAVLTQSMFTVETDEEYSLELEVSGRNIRASINGILVNEAEDPLAAIEPLYYSASVEEASGDIILKAVNVQESVITAKLVLADWPSSGMAVRVYELSGHSLDAENSFEFPARVAPAERPLAVEGNSLSYEFPPHSVTVLRMSRTSSNG